MRVELEILGVDSVAADLRKIGERVEQPLGPLFESVADLWITDFQGNFERQGFDGEAWEPLSEFTKAMRARRGFNPDHPILVRTGDLLQSIRIMERSESDLAVGTDLRYAEVLQNGGFEDYHEDEPGVRAIPPRRFLGLTETLLADTVEMMDDYFFGEGARAA